MSQLTEEKLHNILSDIFKQQDRSASIVAGSIIDELLEKLIKGFLLQNSDDDNIFKGMAPLSTFNAKIYIAYSLGLIDKHQFNDLKLIKKIRNLFAHSIESISFETAEIKDRCLLLKSFPSTKDENASAKDRFKFNAIMIALILFVKSNEIKPLKIYQYKNIKK